MKNHQVATFHILTVLVFSFLSTSLIAQNKLDDADSFSPNKQKASLYYLGDRNELLIKVNIWGFVQKPGQYLVPTDTDLISLISYAGGPLEDAKLKKVKLIRNEALLASQNITEPTQYAMNGNSSIAVNNKKNDHAPSKTYKKVISIDVNKFLESGNESLIPELKPGDTIVLEGSNYHLISKIFDFTTKLAIVAQTYFWFQAAKK